MKITRRQLRRIINEELSRISEASEGPIEALIRKYDLDFFDIPMELKALGRVTPGGDDVLTMAFLLTKNGLNPVDQAWAEVGNQLEGKQKEVWEKIRSMDQDWLNDDCLLYNLADNEYQKQRVDIGGKCRTRESQRSAVDRHAAYWQSIRDRK